jgi:hypothetical protein
MEVTVTGEDRTDLATGGKVPKSAHNHAQFTLNISFITAVMTVRISSRLSQKSDPSLPRQL